MAESSRPTLRYDCRVWWVYEPHQSRTMRCTLFTSYMDSSFIASQVFNLLTSSTEIKIAAIYSVSNRGFITSGLLMSYSRAFTSTILSASKEPVRWTGFESTGLTCCCHHLLLTCLRNLGYSVNRGLSTLCPRTKCSSHTQSVGKGWITRLVLLYALTS